MATAKQLQHRMGLAKKKFATLNKEITAIKNKMKNLVVALKKAKAAPKAKTKKRAGKKKAARKR